MQDRKRAMSFLAITEAGLAPRAFGLATVSNTIPGPRISAGDKGVVSQYIANFHEVVM